MMLGFLTVTDAANSGAEEVAVLLGTHCTAGLTDEQVITFRTDLIISTLYNARYNGCGFVAKQVLKLTTHTIKYKIQHFN